MATATTRTCRVPAAGEGGFVLPLAIIALLFASLLVIPFLDFARLRFGNVQEIAAAEEAYFAADAGIEAVLADLRKGSDVFDGGYVLPVVSLNGFTPTLSVSEPPRFNMAPFGPVFVDPETETSLNPVASNGAVEYVLDNVQPFADFQVSWVYSPSGNNWRLRVYEGAGTGGTLLGSASGGSSPARLAIDAENINGGTYTVEFKNNQTGAITSAAFSPVGDPASTWIRVVAFKDYVVESTVGDQTITVFARQGPGPNQVESTLLVSTWNGPN